MTNESHPLSYRSPESVLFGRKRSSAVDQRIAVLRHHEANQTTFSDDMRRASATTGTSTDTMDEWLRDAQLLGMAALLEMHRKGLHKRSDVRLAIRASKATPVAMLPAAQTKPEQAGPAPGEVSQLDRIEAKLDAVLGLLRGRRGSQLMLLEGGSGGAS